ncbi:hypothetical protein KCM76_22810 [Zooshikella marina]|uniref:hypothetical protein n=1 Tax=Zooshikella ganghwensis TaxID=202772 RepID=UPI001BB0A1E4|nr:hypothetical protein [Zooshikella ganghwensis]MBU2708843.1 hypothetical protein [Zooshikella ganghwensis]
MLVLSVKVFDIVHFLDIGYIKLKGVNVDTNTAVLETVMIDKNPVYLVLREGVKTEFCGVTLYYKRNKRYNMKEFYFYFGAPIEIKILRDKIFKRDLQKIKKIA